MAEEMPERSSSWNVDPRGPNRGLQPLPRSEIDPVRRHRPHQSCPLFASRTWSHGSASAHVKFGSASATRPGGPFLFLVAPLWGNTCCIARATSTLNAEARPATKVKTTCGQVRSTVWELAGPAEICENVEGSKMRACAAVKRSTASPCNPRRTLAM